MDYKTRITIELSDYGAEGQIVMGPAPWTTIKRFQQRATRLVPPGKDGRPDYSKADVVSSNILDVLLFVREAPFVADLEPFFDFMDKLDAKELGSAERLYAEMEKVAARIFSGEESPLAVSQAAETTDSA